MILFSRMPYFHHFVADSMASMNNRYCAQGNNNSKLVFFFQITLFFWQFFLNFFWPRTSGRSLKKHGKVDTEKWSLISCFHFWSYIQAIVLLFWRKVCKSKPIISLSPFYKIEMNIRKPIATCNNSNILVRSKNVRAYSFHFPLFFSHTQKSFHSAPY